MISADPLSHCALSVLCTLVNDKKKAIVHLGVNKRRSCSSLLEHRFCAFNVQQVSLELHLKSRSLSPSLNNLQELHHRGAASCLACGMCPLAEGSPQLTTRRPKLITGGPLSVWGGGGGLSNNNAAFMTLQPIVSQLPMHHAPSHHQRWCCDLRYGDPGSRP